MMKQKVLLLFATLLVLSQPVWAYDFSYTYQGKTLFYSFNGNSVSVVSPFSDNDYSYVTGELIIPDSVEYNNTKYPVTSIGNNAFSYCNGLTSVYIPITVYNIGWGAFNYCTNLTTPNTYR